MKHSPEASEVTLINTCHPWPSTGAPYEARDRQIHDNSNFSDNFSGNISGNISTRKLNTTSRRLPTWLVVLLYLSSFGLVFYVLYQIEASLGQL